MRFRGAGWAGGSVRRTPLPSQQTLQAGTQPTPNPAHSAAVTGSSGVTCPASPRWWLPAPEQHLLS